MMLVYAFWFLAGLVCVIGIASAAIRHADKHKTTWRTYLIAYLAGVVVSGGLLVSSWLL